MESSIKILKEIVSEYDRLIDEHEKNVSEIESILESLD